jgi:hypothetical protein
MAGIRNWFIRLFQRTNRDGRRRRRSPSPYEYTGAGCVFTDKYHILAGYQPRKNIPFISGFGGSKHPGETALVTAIRETIEELYDIAHVPDDLINTIHNAIRPMKLVSSGTYVLAIYSLRDLEILVNVVETYGIESPLYTKLPHTVPELIFWRKKSNTAEISHILLLPYVKEHETNSPFVDPLFLEDMKRMDLTSSRSSGGAATPSRS